MALNLWMKLLFVCTAISCVYSSTKYEPAVAFVCEKGAMHMEPDKGWVSDPSTGCLEGKSEILAYCKKMYPKLAVTNIIESTTYHHIRGWCPVGKKDCGSVSQSFKVRYYRCFTGPFQSDALSVPSTCKFDHIQEKGLCRDFNYWADVAQKACKVKGMRTDTYGMLMPCGTDVFTGVEFVCCPTGQVTSTATAVKLEKPVLKIKIEAEEKPVDDLAVVEKYLTMKSEAYKDAEHDSFLIAKKNLLKVNKEKVTKLLKEWADAKNRIAELSKIDPKGAEKLNKQVTPRFQKEYFALQSSADSRLVQLDSVHQQHVQYNLNTKKRKAAEKLMEVLEGSSHDADEVKRYLQHYLKIEQKDAHHCIKHYLKVRSHDSLAAQAMLPATIEHLDLISTRINQSFGLLAALNSKVMEEEITKSVKQWLNSHYTSLDSTLRKLRESLALSKGQSKDVIDSKPPKSEVTKTANSELAKGDEKEEKKPEMKIVVEAPTVMSSTNYKKFAEKLSKSDYMKKPVVVESKSLDPTAQVNHLAKGAEVSVKSNKALGEVPVNSAADSMTRSVSTAIVICVVAGTVLIFLILAVIKMKKGKEGRSANTYLEVAVDDKVTAEQRHIASMQNGYENPTYKLLEKKTLSI